MLLIWCAASFYRFFLIEEKYDNGKNWLSPSDWELIIVWMIRILVEILTKMMALMLLGVIGNSRSSCSADALIIWFSLCSWMMFSRILSIFLWIFSSLAFIPLIRRTNFSEGKKSMNWSKPPDKDRNSTWSLHLLPNAALHIMVVVKVKTRSLKLIGDPEDEWMESMRLWTTSSRREENDWTLLALRSSNTQIFRICLQ